jgi:hypothetical protein
MKLLSLVVCLLLPLSSFANWKIDLSLGVDGQTWKTDQAIFEDGKEKSIDFGTHKIKLTLKKSKIEKSLDVTFLVEEKKGNAMVIINKGSEIIEDKGTGEIYAKGEPNQPHSIITLKFLK